MVDELPRSNDPDYLEGWEHGQDGLMRRQKTGDKQRDRQYHWGYSSGYELFRADHGIPRYGVEE